MTAIPFKSQDARAAVPQVREAVRSGRPSTIMMADGKSYRVPHTDYIMLVPGGPAVVVHDEEVATLLPLPTMTGISDEAEPTARVAEGDG